MDCRRVARLLPAGRAQGPLCGTRPVLALDSQDDELLHTAFTEGESLILLIQPSRTGPAQADFFMRCEGTLKRGGMLRPFPFRDDLPTILPHPPLVGSEH